MYIYYFIIYLLLPVFTYSCDLLVFIVCVIYVLLGTFMEIRGLYMYNVFLVLFFYDILL